MTFVKLWTLIELLEQILPLVEELVHALEKQKGGGEDATEKNAQGK